MLIAGGIGANSVFAASWDPYSAATNKDSIVNSRHNLTQSFYSAYGASLTPRAIASGSGATGDSALTLMNLARNQYGEVCVFCHTPHGGNIAVAAPLWNHTINTTTYTTWNTLAGTSWYPGPSSLICLGCHDGTVSIDSIINMPGSGKYSESNKDGRGNVAFLNSWSSTWHLPLGDDLGVVLGCRMCHGDHTDNPPQGAPSFRAFTIGADLRNDHPVGITYPATGTPNFNVPANENVGKAKFFGADSTLNKSDIRLVYSSGAYKVECTSCHDPHGVPSAGTGSTFVGSFLRKDNAGSALCLTCHDK
ncbi:MAG: hypothetical protein A2V90_05775 [Gammaproteobacteria bacterium RBG_16_57_12]|nr:MAG: hypothetical protein A2V90_05775 [Gammaproteobacteria bacterium RBG_16_57_12]